MATCLMCGQNTEDELVICSECAEQIIKAAESAAEKDFANCC